MTTCTQRTFINVAKAAAALLVMVATVSAVAATPADRLRLSYLATFGDGSLDASVDRLGIGPMQTGDSQVPDTNPSWTAQGGELVLEITRPSVPIIGPVAAGVFATPVSFGPGTIFEEHATFINPIGPHQTGDQWSPTVGARTGGKNDLANETRTVASLQVRGTALRLNAVGAASPARVDLPQDVYDEIFSPTDPQPFTLKLLIDRVSGLGRVSLVIDDRTFSVDFQPQAFLANSGPVITAVGPSVALGSASGTQTASVHLREFRIFAPSNSSENDADTCPETWDGFSCRAVPESR